MAKLTLNNITSAYGSIATLNANFDAIEAALEKTLSRDGVQPNQMEAALDMNSRDILNAGNLSARTLILNGTEVEAGQLTPVATVQTFEFTATEGQTSSSVSPLQPNPLSLMMSVDGLDIRQSDLSVANTVVNFPPLRAGQEASIKVFLKESGGIPPGGGGGVSSHGDLLDLFEDDHLQYVNETRGDARYLRLVNAGTTIDDRVASLLVAGSNIGLSYDNVNGTLTISSTGSSGSFPTLVIVAATTVTASTGFHYVLTNVAATALTLPAAPVAGDLLLVTSGNSLLTNSVLRNGSRINGVEDDLILNEVGAFITLRYINSTLGWILV
jgi:hypothetical protein